MPLSGLAVCQKKSKVREAIERLVQLVSRALVVQKPRKATRPTRGSVERRLTEKRQRSETKRRRRPDDG